ncbi:MAG: RNA polymerase sigma factor, partial [Nitrospiraceae bacterium]
MMQAEVIKPVNPWGVGTARRAASLSVVPPLPWMEYDARAEELAAEWSRLAGVQTLVSDDLEIIQRVLQGETDQFAELIARYQQHVARIVNRHVPADRVAEVAHDVFVRAYGGLPGYSGQAPFEHWLSRVAVTTCHHFWRTVRREELPVSALTEEHQQWMEHVLAAESDDQFREQAR